MSATLQEKDESTKPVLLITGATGNQGGATIDELLRRPQQRFRLRALVRNPDAANAASLAARGVELVRGDLNDANSLHAALTGVYGVLSVQTPLGHGAAVEEAQGKRLATLSAEAGVKHMVYCSAGGVDRQSGVPHFESKRAIEQHIHDVGLPATILRPAAFMEMLDGFPFRTTMLSMIKTYLKPEQPMQMVSVRDVGWFAAQSFCTPATSIGRAIDLAGDYVTHQQASDVLRRSGKGAVMSFTIPTVLRAWLPEDFRLMFQWIAREGFKADVDALRRAHPQLLTLAAWAQAGRKSAN